MIGPGPGGRLLAGVAPRVPLRSVASTACAGERVNNSFVSRRASVAAWDRVCVSSRRAWEPRLCLGPAGLSGVLWNVIVVSASRVSVSCSYYIYVLCVTCCVQQGCVQSCVVSYMSCVCVVFLFMTCVVGIRIYVFPLV